MSYTLTHRRKWALKLNIWVLICTTVHAMILVLLSSQSVQSSSSISSNSSSSSFRLQNVSTRLYTFPWEIRIKYRCYAPVILGLTRTSNTDTKCPILEAELTEFKFKSGEKLYFCCIIVKVRYFHNPQEFFRLRYKGVKEEQDPRESGGNESWSKTEDNNSGPFDINDRRKITASEDNGSDSENGNNSIQSSQIAVFAYNNFGAPSETFEVVQNCTLLPRDWQNRISSINTNGLCVEVCQYKNCGGRCLQVMPGTLGHNRLRDVNFDKRITSMRACPASTDTTES